MAAAERGTDGTLRRLFVTDPADPGCGHVLAEIERYAELARDGSDPRRAYPELAVHFRSCRACRTDLDGLLEALRRVRPG
jgi:hypothetical protein